MKHPESTSPRLEGIEPPRLSHRPLPRPHENGTVTRRTNGSEPAALLGRPDALPAPGPRFEELAAAALVQEPAAERLDPHAGLQPTTYSRRGKRIFNVVLLVASLPPAAVLALPIALVNWIIFRDHRRILFHQPRVGRDGRLFSIYKFRTMRKASGDDFDSWKEGDDGLRVTGFGRFLRNTHLDELPQLLNVLRGEMDFIGPRPEMVEIDSWARRHIPGFRRRNALPPGITGLAQITHGYACMDPDAYRNKLHADLYYLHHVSLRLDLEILARTALWMLRGRGWRRVGRPERATRAAGPSVRESSTA